MSEKIKMQLGRLDNENPVKAGNVETDRTKEFLKAQIAEETPSTTRKGNSLKVTDQGKMVEVARKDALDAYPPEKVIEQEIPFPKDESPSTPVAKKGKKGVIEYLKGAKKKLFMTLGFITLAGAAKATDNNSAEKELSNNKNTIEHVNKDPGEGGKKVKEVPPGYVKSHVDGKKTYYKKVTGGTGGELKQAKPGDGKRNKQYENKMKDWLKSGKYTAKELEEKGYISDAEKYHKYYTPPAVDIVYTEPEPSPEPDPYSAYAKDGESIWGTNRHLIAILSVPVRDTKSITESGNINTSNSEHMVLVRFVDKMGKPTGECVELKTGEIQDYFGTTMTMQSDELMKKLKAKIEKNPTYVATAEDFAKNK